jgi:hypothetical protein
MMNSARFVWKRFAIVIVSVFMASVTTAQLNQPSGPVAPPSAAVVIERALAIVGGPDITTRVRVINTEESRLTYHLADSEHSLPPYIPDYGITTQWIDISIPAFHADSTVAAATGDQRISTQIARQGFSVSRSTFNGKTSGQRVGLEPSRWKLQNPLLVLLTASRSSALKELVSADLFGTRHWRISFHDRGNRVTLWINSFNDHLDAVDLFGSDQRDLFWNEWGDVTLRTMYSDWHYESGGLHYPHQWNIYFNGELQETRSVRRLIVNPEMVSVDMSVPEEGRPTAADVATVDEFPLGRSDRPITEVLPGIVQIPGNWYVTLVKQSDGIVVIDAPISNGYSVKVIAEAARRFPGVKIKAVIATTNFWWHIGGLREYAARRIPIYVPDQNVALIQRLLKSPHTLAPDSLEKAQAVPVVFGVSSARTIGTGKNQIVLYPIRTATAQMMMAWFPEHKMLDTAEMAQPLGPNGTFLYPESLLELRRSVQTNHLQVDTVIGMHMSQTPWSKILEALASASEHGEGA